jgi:hypothetical protein
MKNKENEKSVFCHKLVYFTVLSFPAWIQSNPEFLSSQGGTKLAIQSRILEGCGSNFDRYTSYPDLSISCLYSDLPHEYREIFKIDHNILVS